MRRNLHLSILVALFAIACGANEPERQSNADRALAEPQTGSGQHQRCGLSRRPYLTSTGIGSLQIGTLVSDIEKNCNIRADTIELDAEGMPQRVLRIQLRGDEVRALVADNRIWRIELGGGTFKTTDSLGVGDTLATLLANGEVTGVEGDGLLYVLVREYCGLSFRLSYVPGDQEHRPTWSEQDLSGIPGNAVVDRVLITGCEPVP